MVNNHETGMRSGSVSVGKFVSYRVSIPTVVM